MQGDEAANAAAAGMGIGILLVYFAIIGLMLASFWKIFSKADKPGWAGIIPIYNTIVLLEIVGKPVWWIVLMFIPLVSIVIWILMMLSLAERFGKGAGMGIGMSFLPFIFLPMLAFSDAQYSPPPPA
jgi:hypothetical protein